MQCQQTNLIRGANSHSMRWQNWQDVSELYVKSEFSDGS